MKLHTSFRALAFVTLLACGAFNYAYPFEELGPLAKPMDTTHVWKPQAVGQKFRYRNNITDTEGFVEFIEVTDDTRAIRVGTSSCIQTFPLYPFAPTIKFVGCGRNGDRAGGQEFWVKGDIFPLKKGRKWKFYTKNLLYTEGEKTVDNPKKQTHKCKVKDEVRVNTIAGQFDTFKVVCNPGFEIRTYYYAPEIGNSVAFRREKPRGKEDRNSEWLGPE